MQPGMWTSYLFDLSPEDMVVQFVQKGWPLLELSDEHGHALLGRGSPETVGQTFRTFAQDHGVTFPQGHLWLKFDITAEGVEKTLDMIKPWLDLFLAIGIRAGVLHPGGRAMREAGRGTAEIQEIRTHALQAIGDYLRGTDLVICLENMSDTADAQYLLDLIQATDSANLAVCLDTGHLHLTGGNSAGFVCQVGTHLKALHIADNEGKSDQHLMPFGRGTVDWSGMVSELKRLPYEGLFNFEIPGENRCPLPVRLAKLDYIKTVAQMMLDETV